MEGKEEKLKDEKRREKNKINKKHKKFNNMSELESSRNLPPWEEYVLNVYSFILFLIMFIPSHTLYHSIPLHFYREIYFHS